MSEIIEKIQLTPALDDLLRQREKFVRFVEKRVGSAAIAEDIVQTAFVRGLENPDALQEQDSAMAWFYRVLRNAVIDHYRASGTKEKALEAWAKELERHQEISADVRNQLCDCITEVVHNLKDEYRTALQISEIEERSLRDLARETGISEANAAVRLHRARKALLKRVQETCGSCAEHRCIDCRCKY